MNEAQAASCKVGVAGLGRAFSVMLPTFRRTRALRSSPPPIRDRKRGRGFTTDFGGKGYASVEELCADPEGGDRLRGDAASASCRACAA